jgi:dipeptidyl-peptidase 4
VTDLHGMLHKPSDFDPVRKYPVLVSVYGGPGTNGARETFTLPNALTEYGFLVVTLDGAARAAAASAHSTRSTRSSASSRSTTWPRRCRRSRAALRRRRARRHLRHVVRRLRLGDGAAASPRRVPRGVGLLAGDRLAHYDTIYTERYMWIPQENTNGYDAGSAMTYVDNLRAGS